jgi:hypothetical protein
MAAAAIVFVTVAPAHALGAKASLANGVVTVTGGQAAKSAPISWEGVVVTAFVMFWSSTSWAGYQPQYNAWAVNFRDSYSDLPGMLPFGKASSLRVRAVRGGL